MRRFVLALVLCLGGVACGRDGADPAPVDTTTPISTTAPVHAPTTSTSAATTTAPPVFDVESLPPGASLVLGARESVPVFTDPGGTEPYRVLESTTLLGTTTVLIVLEGPANGWAKVMLPGRPNGSEGWVRSDGMVLFVVEGRLVVDLSDRTLVYFEGEEEVLSTEVAVGSGRNPTPAGSFFVTDNVTMADPGSPWGPHALGLSARSETITEFNGGDGIIGIHGTNNPGSIGEAASLGCVRVPNEVITLLHELVRIGTPVEIRV
ncbi:MAG: L,D-transpeptidase [Acidimicrobiia bacterium]